MKPESRRSALFNRVVLGLAILAALASVASSFARQRAGDRPAVRLDCQLVAVDGDTLRCGGERIRLLGIDAPELPGHCRKERVCAPGDPFASFQSLASMLGGPATIERRARDRYGRTLAYVTVRGVDLSRAQLRRGMAVPR